VGKQKRRSFWPLFCGCSTDSWKLQPDLWNESQFFRM